jgi:DNA-binding beta-propeller fold protein YncE
MSLRHEGYITLPPHAGPGSSGGFDHAAIYQGRGLLYVAHTANDAVDVIDCVSRQYVGSVPNLTGVAGALVSEEDDLVFTSNRGENTVGIFSPESPDALVKVPVGVRPNGLAYAADRGLLLVAHVGDPTVPDSTTVSLIDVDEREVGTTVPVPGRTRWTVYDPATAAFYINIADPALIAVVELSTPDRIARSLPIPSAGPHGLDLDPERGRLFCACDGGQLFALDAATGRHLAAAPLAGVPDVIWYHAALDRVYVAIGDPGVIEVFDAADADSLRLVESVSTERGAKTTALDTRQGALYVFQPETHRAALFVDAGP